MNAGGTTNLGASVASYSAWNLVAYLVGIAANILTLPFALGHLGPSAFGVAALVQATVAPFTLVATTLGMATARQLAAAEAAEFGSARLDFGASAAAALMAASAGVLIIALVGPTFSARVFAVGPRDAALLPGAYLAAAIGWGATVGTALLQAIYVATRDYRRIAHVGAFGAVTTAVAIFVLVGWSPSVVSYLSALSIGFIAVMLAWAVVARIEKRAMLRGPHWEPRRLRALGEFSGWQIAAQIGGIASIQADRYLLGTYTRPADVAFYSVAQRLEEVAYIGVAKAGEVLFPVFSAEAVSARARQADLYFRAAWILNLLAACMLGPLLPLAGDILRVWTNAATAERAEGVLFILALGGLLGCGVNALAFFTLGLARTRLNFILAVVTAGISVSVSAVLLPRYGLAAAGVGTACAMAAQLALGVVISQRLFGDRRVGRQLFAVVGPLGVAIVIGLSLRACGVLPHPEGWIKLIALSAGVAGVIATTVFATTYLSAQGSSSRRDLGAILTRFVPHQLKWALR